MRSEEEETGVRSTGSLDFPGCPHLALQVGEVNERGQRWKSSELQSITVYWS